MALAETPKEQKVTVKQMSWDPVTRIVGSLGIHTEIDFTNQQVLKCWSTSMLFRGFDIFMKGIDPRDAHFITSRICGICGDNHCTCSCLNQNMAYSVKPPKLGDFAFNLAESADFMFDHAIYNDCMANVDYSEQMVKETNPAVLAKAETTPAPHSDIHGYKTIADIMRALNAFTGEFYLETLQVARYTREMYCLFGGRHTHPSTILPGGCSANITQQTCTEYYVRLMRYIDYCKRTVPMHDDLYDFFYEALPGYERVGFRETDLVCWGCFDDPDHVDYDYKNMTEWGRHRYVTPGLVFGGELITTDLVEINLAIRILLGSSYFDDWTNEETFVSQDPLGNPVDKRHPWNKVTLPKPQARDFADKYSWVASPRMEDKRDRQVRRQRHRRRPVRAPVGHREGGPGRLRLPEGDRREHPDGAAQDGVHARDAARVEDPALVERDRAPAGADVPPGVLGARRAAQPRAGARGDPRRPDEELERLHRAGRGDQRGLPRGRPRGAVAPHGHPRGQDRQLPAVPADPVERQPARLLRDAGALRGRRAEHADLRGERSRRLQGRRHHARRPLVRPLPPLRRAHVRQGPRQGAQGGAHADRDVLMSEELAAELVEVYGEGLRRIFAALDAETVARLADDEVVAGLMLAHGLYPVGLEDRVREALDSVRPYMESHGGDVELLGISDGVAALRMSGSCSGCGASQTTLEHAIEAALQEHAPDLLGIDVEGVVAAAPRRPEAAPEADWVELPEVAGLPRGAVSGTDVGLVVANVAGTLLAYRDRCAGCGCPLADGMLLGGKLTCAHCGMRFDLPRAGRCADGEGPQLEPVPLLRNGGPVRVAIAPEPASAGATCELCPIGIGEHHRHLLHLVERRIVCVCETCWSTRSGDPEFRPPGSRTLLLEDFDMSDEVWAGLGIPIGLTFLMRSSVSGGVVALYPSPAGATESELDLGAWDTLCAANPVLDRLEPDAEALVIDRTATDHVYAIVPVDQAYKLVGLVKERWEGISGGRGVQEAVAEYFEALA